MGSYLPPSPPQQHGLGDTTSGSHFNSNVSFSLGMHAIILPPLHDVYPSY